MSMQKQKIHYNSAVLFIIIIGCAIIGKTIRYTLMKSVLVDTGIGHSWLNLITDESISIRKMLSANIASGQNGFAMTIYRLLNIFHLKTYGAYEAAITVIYNIILFFLVKKAKNTITVAQFFFMTVSFVVLNIFDFCLSKEPIQMLGFIAIYNILISRKCLHKFIWIIIVLLISALIFRIYYFFIVMFMIEIEILVKIFFNAKQRALKKLLIALTMVTISYCIMLVLLQRSIPAYYSELIRVRSRIGTASTDIRNIFHKQNLFSYSFNYFFVAIRLLFPIELISRGPKYIMYVAYQLMITYIIMGKMKAYGQLPFIQRTALQVFLGFIFTSAMFEPDFGSWIRHEAVIFPILLVINNLTYPSIEHQGPKPTYKVRLQQERQTLNG